MCVLKAVSLVGKRLAVGNYCKQEVHLIPVLIDHCQLFPAALGDGNSQAGDQVWHGKNSQESSFFLVFSSYSIPFFI